jgi:hypothetical protein
MGITAFVLKYRIGYSGGTPEEVNLVCSSTYGGQKQTPEFEELKKKNTEITQSMTTDFGKQDKKELKIDKNITIPGAPRNFRQKPILLPKPCMDSDTGTTAIRSISGPIYFTTF